MTLMAGTHRIRLTERDSMEGGVRCPNCGSYTSFGDIIATGHCRGVRREEEPCETGLAIDLVVRETDIRQTAYELNALDPEPLDPED
ncbi:hypothetical protein SAMN04487948_103269 [Halogranum amylolyticum]|uniref:Uncharacterized protein n=1 Tax=Halogranum amylolyticum TaxID=660520 RepID=A0A1H8QRI0_9EURY|nr:hypothetical protein SAMN04487948_103269 [Halogranum amylolyticum]